MIAFTKSVPTSLGVNASFHQFLNFRFGFNDNMVNLTYASYFNKSVAEADGPALEYRTVDFEMEAPTVPKIIAYFKSDIIPGAQDAV